MVSDEAVSCPFCGGVLVYRSRRLRGSMNIIGEKRRVLLRRFRCKKCKTMHTEIPDIIQPHKHYDSATIQSVLDGSEDSAECVADDSTMRRWRKAFAEAEPDVAQRLASVYAQITDEHVPLVSAPRILDTIRTKQHRWFPFVMGLLINNGYKICTRFAFCPPAPVGTIALTDKNKTEGGAEVDKTIDDTS